MPQSPGMPVSIGVKESKDRSADSYGESRAGISLKNHNMDGVAAGTRQVNQGKESASVK